MPFLRRTLLLFVLPAAVFLQAILVSPSPAQQTQSTQTAEPQSPTRPFTIETIYGQPGLNGRLTRGIAWTPDSKQLSFFKDVPASTLREPRSELWILDVASGKSRVLVSAEKLESLLPSEKEKSTQATGLGRRPPSQYQWAPNGGALLFQSPTALAWFDLNTQSARTLVSGKAALADPKISPDGRYVSFLRDHNVWLVGVADGQERALTQGGSEGVRKGELDWVYPEELDCRTAYWWAPDSSAIAYLEMDERKVSQYPLVEFASPSGEADMERYPFAGGTNPTVRVLVASLKGGEQQTMDIGTETDIYIPRVNWLRDSKRVAIQRLNRMQTQLDLLITDAADGKSHMLLSKKDPYWVNLSEDLYFFHDGKRLLWSSERSGFRHLYVFDLEGKQLAQITKGDWEVTGLDAVDEAKGIAYFTAAEKSPLERHLYEAGLNGRGFVRITQDDGTHGINMATDASAFLDTYSNTMNPQRQDLFWADGRRVAVINENRVEELAGYHLSPMEFFTVKSRDGVLLNASMIKPPDFDPRKKYPVLVYTYGGPHAQVVRNAWGGSNFLWHQLMARKGFIIFSLDNRGSAGRGHAFETPLHFRMGKQELEDQRDGVAWLKTQPYVDGGRIGIWGWSYGGHMTLHAMFESGDDFKAGFAGGPVTDWHYYDTIYTERYLGLPQHNAKGYEDSSPLKYAAQLKGKLLIAHGTGDDNVHYANTLSVINRLIDAGQYVEVLAFPGRGHGVSDPAARRVLMHRVMQFFLDNL